MRTPKRPPDFLKIMQEVAKKPERLMELSSIYLEPQQEDYHWDELAYRTPPKGLSHEEWWLVLKMQRARSLKTLPLKDKNGTSFHYTYQTDRILEMLHYIDREASGPFVVPTEVINPETRKRYLERSLLEEAITSSQLEGAATTRKVAKEMIRSKRSPSDKSEQMIYNNYMTMEHIRELKDSLRFIDTLRRTRSTIRQNPEESGCLKSRFGLSGTKQGRYFIIRLKPGSLKSE
jgi:hypothetical protein